MAGVPAEVPPTSCAVGSVVGLVVVRHEPSADTHTRYADPRNPLPAKNDTSGKSRLRSAGMPLTPACHAGLAYPPVQLATVEPSLVVQLLAPPPPPTVSTSPARLTDPLVSV